MRVPRYTPLIFASTIAVQESIRSQSGRDSQLKAHSGRSYVPASSVRYGTDSSKAAFRTTILTTNDTRMTAVVWWKSFRTRLRSDQRIIPEPRFCLAEYSCHVFRAGNIGLHKTESGAMP